MIEAAEGIDARRRLLEEAQRLERRARRARWDARSLDATADRLPELRITLTLWDAVPSDAPRLHERRREAVDVDAELRREARRLRSAADHQRRSARRDEVRAAELRSRC